MKVFSYRLYEKFRDDMEMSDYRVSQETGIPKQTISDWKLKNCNPRIDSMVKLSSLFGVPMEAFIEEVE